MCIVTGARVVTVQVLHFIGRNMQITLATIYMIMIVAVSHVYFEQPATEQIITFPYLGWQCCWFRLAPVSTVGSEQCSVQ
jgi:hypothetical protein